MQTVPAPQVRRCKVKACSATGARADPIVEARADPTVEARADPTVEARVEPRVEALEAVQRQPAFV